MAKKYLRFAARLRELREEADVSMVELARAIGVSDAAVCKWENGQAEPKIGYIVKLAEYFDCPIDYLIGTDGFFAEAKATITDSDGKPLERAKAASVVLTKDEQGVIASYKKLSPKMQTLLKETIDAWVGVGDESVEPDKE